METKPLIYTGRPLIVTVSAVVLLELVASMASGPWFLQTGVLRMLEILVMLAAAQIFYPKAQLPGILPPDLARGLKKGLLWSAGFGMVAGLGAGVLYLAGHDPVRLLGMRMPAETVSVVLLFLVGGLIGPLAEELFFRGVVFGALRRWGAIAAIFGSSLLFVLAHFGNGGITVTHAAGGVIFALAYELEKNLLVPVVIHVSGNMALFGIGLLAA
jgi:membrane protease YdiL (CAAX protease family)